MPGEQCYFPLGATITAWIEAMGQKLRIRHGWPGNAAQGVLSVMGIFHQLRDRLRGGRRTIGSEDGSDVNLEHMRKRLIAPTPPGVQLDRDHRLDVSTTALVEVTSEEKDHPIESALIPGESKGWRASEPGTHTIRLIFDRPQKLKRITLVFEEKETSRTQEFVLRWSPNPEGALREIVRQQWNFSPPRTTNEVEEYRVELSDVTVLEMTITPDIAGGTARASLNSLAVY